MFYIQKRILYSFFILFFSLGSAAQENYRAVHWGLEDGLSQAETSTIIKDIKGFLWVGTKDGLNRFDGYTFKIFYHDDKVANSLIDNSTGYGMVEDSLHNIWIGTGYGISRYSIKADTFANFFPDTAGVKYDFKAISPFWATKKEVLCLESEAKIISYNIESGAKKVLVNFSGYWFPGPAASYSIFDNSSNTAWLLVVKQENNATGLLQVSISDGVMKFFPFPENDPVRGAAEAMCYDVKRNSIWINSHYGLIQFSLSDKLYHHIDALRQYESLKGYGRFVGIELDQKGRVWLATMPRGILIFNPDDESVHMPFENDTILQKSVSEFNSTIYSDRDGIVWLGFWSRGGISQLLPFAPVVRKYLPNPQSAQLFRENNSNEIGGILPAGGGKLWVLSTGDLFIFDSRSYEFDPVPQVDIPGWMANKTRLIRLDTVKRKAWISFDNKYYVIDTRTFKSKPIVFVDTSNKFIPQAKIRNSFPRDYSSGFIITGSFDDKQCVFLMGNDTVAKEVLSFPNEPFNGIFTKLVGNNLIFLNGKDKKKGHQTYKKINNQWKRVTTPWDKTDRAFFIFNEADSSYWVPNQNNGRLIHFSNDFAVMASYGQENGLPVTFIRGLVPDNKGNIWFYNDWAIYVLNAQTGQIARMSEKDGFEKTDFDWWPISVKDAQGDIYFPNGIFALGFTRISPGSFTSQPSSIYFQSLLINQKPFQLPSGVNDLQQLSLRYFQNKIEIETGIIDYYAKGKSRIRYKLAGNNINENWQYAPYYYTIRYDGLPPGKYRLVTQASNAANEFIGPEKILIIDISPPFWTTWWFRTLALLSATGLIYAVFQYRSRQLRARNILLENKVMERTTDLKHSLEELRTTQTQLIQSEKMASLGELTAGIAHEIQNPLNFMNNFSEVNAELIDEMQQEIDKGNFADAKAISNDIKENEQKISHHGKRADAIVKGMLQHSRTSTGVKEPTDINALADEYFRLAYHGLRAKDKSFNATMKSDFDERIGNISIIPQEVGRVILNLVTNAFYAVTEKKKQLGDGYEPTVWVSTKKTNGTVEIKVKDNGNGIPQKLVDKIFQPFFTTKPTGQGTGLGLSLSYDIITKVHNGQLKVDTKEGEYAEFTISLPV